MPRQCFRVAGGRHRPDGLDPLLLLPHLVHGRDFQFPLMVHPYVVESQFHFVVGAQMVDVPQIQDEPNPGEDLSLAVWDRPYLIDQNQQDAPTGAGFQMHCFQVAQRVGAVLVDAVFQRDCFPGGEPGAVGWPKS